MLPPVSLTPTPGPTDPTPISPLDMLTTYLQQDLKEAFVSTLAAIPNKDKEKFIQEGSFFPALVPWITANDKWTELLRLYDAVRTESTTQGFITDAIRLVCEGYPLLVPDDARPIPRDPAQEPSSQEDPSHTAYHNFLTRKGWDLSTIERLVAQLTTMDSDRSNRTFYELFLTYSPTPTPSACPSGVNWTERKA